MTKDPKVLLLSLPWTSLVEPSLGLGILKSKLIADGIQCTVRHLNIFLLKYLRSGTYISLANSYALNDFLFTRIFEEELSEKQKEKLRWKANDLLNFDLLLNEGYESVEDIQNMLLAIRDKIIPEYLRECLDFVYSSKATMVGLTCMFDQTVASLALSKLIKEFFPEKFIVFGGYALEGPTGEQLINSFDFIDCINYGEGEDVITSLAKASVDKELLKTIPGIIYRDLKSNKIVRTAKKQPISMDDSPIPDYDDFVSDIKELEHYDKVHIIWETIPIETSRGCWWGQTQHCVFCGIDDETLKYRTRSESNTLQILSILKNRYHKNIFRISDYILPYNFYRSLLPTLAEIEEKFVFSCEIKANVTYEQFKVLKDAGFVEVQPGIESFSTSVLKKMNKGVSGIQNIYTLLLGLMFDIEVHYNFLFGFPSDSEEDYKRLTRIIPLLYHLIPPVGKTHIAITRFAPLQTNPERFGITEPIVYDPVYDLIFSESFVRQYGFDFNNYCYYFKIPYNNSDELKTLYEIIIRQITYWKEIHRTRQVILSFSLKDDVIVFTDGRYGNEPKTYEFDADYALFYEECKHQIVALSEIRKSLLPLIEPQKIEEIIQTLCEEGLIYVEGNKLIALALEESVYARHSQQQKSMKWASPFV